MSRMSNLLVFPALLGVVLLIVPGTARPSKDFSESGYSLFSVPETDAPEAAPPEAGGFEIDQNRTLEEIDVPEGVDFMVRLRGSGWQVQGYDPGTLSVRRRTEGEEYTDFVVSAHTAGRGYLLFDRGGEQTHVSVRVEDRGRAGGTEPLRENDDLSVEVPTVPEVPEPSFSSPLLEKTPAEKKPGASAVEKSENGTSGKSAEKAGGKPPKESPKGTEKKTVERQVDEHADGVSSGGSGIYYVDKENRVVEVPVGNENEPYRRGIRFQQSGAGEKALESYEEYLDGCKKCLHADEVHLRSAELYLKTARGGEAEAHIEQLTRSSSREYRLKGYLLRADMDYRNGNMKRAIEGYAAALGIDAGNRELERKIGDLYYEAKEWESAARFYERSIQNGTADDEVYFRAALIRDGAGPARDLEKAYRYYKALVLKFDASTHREFAEQRIRFLERHFYDYK